MENYTDPSWSNNSPFSIYECHEMELNIGYYSQQRGQEVEYPVEYRESIRGCWQEEG